MHHQTCFFKSLFDIFENLFSNVMSFQQMTKFQQRGCIRYLLIEKIDVHETTHSIAVVDGLLNSFVRQREPILQQIHSQHCLYTGCFSAPLILVIVGFDECNPVLPWYNGFHGVQKLFPLCYFFAICIFHIAECLLPHL